jgi:hypothetical protein
LSIIRIILGEIIKIFLREITFYVSSVAVINHLLYLFFLLAPVRSLRFCKCTAGVVGVILCIQFLTVVNTWEIATFVFVCYYIALLRKEWWATPASRPLWNV